MGEGGGWRVEGRKSRWRVEGRGGVEQLLAAAAVGAADILADFVVSDSTA